MPINYIRVGMGWLIYIAQLVSVWSDWEGTWRLCGCRSMVLMLSAVLISLSTNQLQLFRSQY